MMTMAAASAGLAAGPASAELPLSIDLLCTAAANNGTLEGSVCVLPFGVTTAPNAYSVTIAVGKAGAAGATVTFALTAGSLPPGLSMPAGSGSGTVITGNPTKAGTYAYWLGDQRGPDLHAGLPDHRHRARPPGPLLCAAANGSFLIGGVCTLPDAVLGLPYKGT